MGTLQRSTKRFGQKSILIAAAVAGILAIPLIGMRFTDEVRWDVADFAIIGALLFGAGLVYVLGIGSLKSRSVRVLLTMLLVVLVVLVWAELAVGVIGSSFAGS